MKRGIRLLAVLSAALLLISGCGVQLYEMTEEEEDLVVQGAAYMLSKYNIYQKDGMNGALPPQEEAPAPKPEASEGTGGQDEPEDGAQQGGAGSGPEEEGQESVPLETISLPEAVGYADKLSVSYEGYSLMDVYQEGSYFSLSAESGHTFVVMRFKLRNQTDKELKINNFDKGCAFYCSVAGTERVPEKESFITNSLASFEGTIAAGRSAKAVLIFEITKEQAELIGEPSLTVEQGGTSYSINL